MNIPIEKIQILPAKLTKKHHDEVIIKTSLPAMDFVIPFVPEFRMIMPRNTAIKYCKKHFKCQIEVLSFPEQLTPKIIQKG